MRCCYLKFVESRVALISPISFERRLYHATFGLEDFKEGMAAFVRVQVFLLDHRARNY